MPGATFGGVWVCVQGSDSFSDRFTVTVNDAAAGGAVTVFTPADQRVPATAICTVTEDTQDANGLRDASFAWGEPTYAPVDVALVAGEIASLGVTNTVVRVYSDVAVLKVVTGPAEGLVPTDRPFTGTITCQYGTDAPIDVDVVGDARLPVPARRRAGRVGVHGDRRSAGSDRATRRRRLLVHLDRARCRWSGDRDPARRGDTADRRHQPDGPAVRHVQRQQGDRAARSRGSPTSLRRSRWGTRARRAPVPRSPVSST